MTREEKRKIPVKFIVHSEGWFMTQTNWSQSYSAGVVEYTNASEALTAGKSRTTHEPCTHSVEVYGYNEFGERIQ